jgi:2-oxoglutarate dehydrogenase E2 component (dihydrolipoamide succinyltransferase)
MNNVATIFPFLVGISSLQGASVLKGSVIPYTRRRRLTADHMVYSKLVAPHVVTVAEIDLHRTMRLREANKEAYKREGISLTLLAFVCNAVVRTLRELPGVNARVLEDSYVLLRDINLGVAVDAPDGLVVPNIKRADDYPYVDWLAQSVTWQSERAMGNSHRMIWRVRRLAFRTRA